MLGLPEDFSDSYVFSLLSVVWIRLRIKTYGYLLIVA